MEKILICIGREFGSGGHKVGQMISSERKIPYYDDEILLMAAQRGNLELKEMAHYDEKRHNDYFYTMNFKGNIHAKKGIPTAETLFFLQSEIIKKLAESGSGVFVGRCADWVLKESGYPALSVFIAAPRKARIERVMAREGLLYLRAKRTVKRKDRERRRYYERHTGRSWGKPESYDLYFDSSETSLVEIVDRILAALPGEQEFSGMGGAAEMKRG